MTDITHHLARKLAFTPNSVKSVAFSMGLCVLGAANLAVAESYQSHGQIRTAVATFVNTELTGQDVEVEVGALDERLKLRQCDSPIEAFWPPGARRQGRGAVGVRCNDERTWRMFVRVNIQVFESVAVLSASKIRGEALQLSDLRFERKETTRLRDKFLTDADSVEGYIFRRSAKAGDVLGLRMLKAPHVVKRGEQVVILADTAGIQVKMRGQALSDGMRGSVIRVRNSSSKRVVEGEVVDKGVVKVRF